MSGALNKPLDQSDHSSFKKCLLSSRAASCHSVFWEGTKSALVETSSDTCWPKALPKSQACQLVGVFKSKTTFSLDIIWQLLFPNVLLAPQEKWAIINQTKDFLMHEKHMNMNENLASGSLGRLYWSWGKWGEGMSIFWANQERDDKFVVGNFHWLLDCWKPILWTLTSLTVSK